MYAMCNTEGNQFLLLSGIVDHQKDGEALDRANMYIKRGSNVHYRKTTKGWELCVEWKDGSTFWERLVDLKESNPGEVANYAIAQGIKHEPDFVWWASPTIKRRNRIIAEVTTRYHKRTHMFGIEIPKTLDDCIRIDKENGNTLWQDAIQKEMSTVRIAFKILNDDESAPPTFQEIRCHFARFFAGGHITETPASATYASVLSSYSMRIALTLAALNDLEVKTADIENAYLTAPAAE
jgi:hypothetical protein